MDDSNLQQHETNQSNNSKGISTPFLDPEEEIEGLNFSRLIQRWPDLSPELLSFRDLLISTSQDDDSQVMFYKLVLLV